MPHEYLETQYTIDSWVTYKFDDDKTSVVVNVSEVPTMKTSCHLT